MKEGTVLDLPEEQQRKIAAHRGMSLEEWRQNAKRVLASNAEHDAEFEWGVRPDGFTEEDAKRFQKKIDSSGQSAEQVWSPYDDD